MRYKQKREKIHINKKGIVQGFAFVMVIIFTIAITIVLNKVIFSNINEKGVFQDSDTAQAIADEFIGSTYPAMDSLFLGAFIAAFIFLTAISVIEGVRTHPAFFPIIIFLVMPVMILLAVIISNVYQEFGENATWAAAEADSGTKQVEIMDNLPFYVFGMSILWLLAVFGITRARGG